MPQRLWNNLSSYLRSCLTAVGRRVSQMGNLLDEGEIEQNKMIDSVQEWLNKTPARCVQIMRC